MLSKLPKIVLFILLGIALHNEVFAQQSDSDTGKRITIGLNYGQASQAHIPFDSKDYLYENSYFKMQLNYLLKQKNKFGFELHIEPSIYSSHHQLLNKYFIQPNSGDDYLEQRDYYTQYRSFTEYALNFGIIIRYNIFKPFSTYFLASIGPMYGTDGTERLHEGFAFSDIVGLGLAYQIKKVFIDLRLTLRHNSNANLQEPNSGHNSVGLETGIAFQL